MFGNKTMFLMVFVTDYTCDNCCRDKEEVLGVFNDLCAAIEVVRRDFMKLGLTWLGSIDIRLVPSNTASNQEEGDDRTVVSFTVPKQPGSWPVEHWHSEEHKKLTLKPEPVVAPAVGLIEPH